MGSYGELGTKPNKLDKLMVFNDLVIILFLKYPKMPPSFEFLSRR